jgi:uncharacterized protein
MGKRFTLTQLPARFAIVQLPADAPIPDWALLPQPFVTISRTGTELSIVCPQSAAPADVKAQRDWVCLRIEGPFNFSEIGVLSSVAEPLAESAVSIFAISTYETDYLLIHSEQLTTAKEALCTAGHQVQPS